MINKLLPSSLVGQISLIMLLGVLLVLSVSLQLYSQDRQRALNFVSSDSTLERVSSLITILNNTPIALHKEIISASQGRGFYLSLDTKAVVLEQGEQTLSNKLKALNPDSTIEDVRIVTAQIKRPPRKNGKPHPHDERRLEKKKKQRYNIKLTGSVLLSEQHWLNFSSAIDEQVAHLPLKTVLWVVLFTLLILLLMAWTVKRALKPIETLAKVAKKVGSERDFKNINETGPSEVIPAIIAFNQMQENLASFIDDRSKMLAAISHDLRTPITSLRLRLEFIEPGEDQKRMLETVHQMEKMLKATLDFAKDDAHKEVKQELEVVSLLTTICDEYRDQGIDIQLSSADRLIVRLWPIAFRRVIENLINNSVAYGQNEDGKVCISIDVHLEAENLVIAISDTGQGVEESFFSEIIKPFVRLDKARDTEDSSVGLGLAISHGIVHAHAGEMLFSNLASGGFRVQISLPRN
ncbi:two-component sensor histidine kinase [Psychromonas sp. psych-6C06]|uniref:sensor histidine kinase n=1 Tax=Psychromonas sp. psych-6C06 TaxID=2058089 RepID=UPI000C342BC0|nr:HAMP domain-containing sensor histidine kinase [Psychromonas sp. psych-6C06]PKF61477.1 two-component sensor histidine kinase [Psychromonas sp. psych-6C06]